MKLRKTLIYVSLFLFLFTSCSNGNKNIPANSSSIVTTQTSVSTITNTTSNKEPVSNVVSAKPAAFNTDELTASIINIVNDDIWYNGQYSQFKNLENRKMEIEIYVDNIDPDSPWIIFDDGVTGIFYSQNIQYLSVGLYKSEITNTYENWFGSYFADDTLKETRSQVLSSPGTHLIRKTVIEFGEAHKPVFTPPSKEKEKIIEGILKQLPENFDYLELSGGKREIQIRNFSENDHSTTVIFKDDNDDLWFADFNLEGPTISYFSKVDCDWYKYLINQDLKVAIKKEIDWPNPNNEVISKDNRRPIVITSINKSNTPGLKEIPQIFNINSMQSKTSYKYDMNEDGIKDNVSLVYNGDLLFKVNKTEINFAQQLDEYSDNTVKNPPYQKSIPDITISHSPKDNTPIVKIAIGFQGADNFHFDTWTFRYPKDIAAQVNTYPGLMICDQFETDFRGNSYEYNYFRFYKDHLEEISALGGLKNSVKAGIIQSIFLNGSFDPNHPELLKGTAAEGTKPKLIKDKLRQLISSDLVEKSSGKYFINAKLIK